MSKSLFDKLSAVGKRIRQNSDVPFGGLQLIVCGDFFQLPPVMMSDRNQFCFESSTWKSMFNESNVIILDQVFRQRETMFLNILHELRRGEVSAGSRELLAAKARAYSSRPPVADGGVMPTVLYSTNRDVDRINAEELERLTSPVQEFQAADEGPHIAQLKNMRAPELLKLKEGAQVTIVIPAKSLNTREWNCVYSGYVVEES